MTSLMGRLADKANVIKAGFSDLEKAVIKSTKHNLKSPKEKHVRRLIVFTFEQPSKIHEIITLLAKRLEILDWIVVMKALEVFHRLLKDGNAQFIADLKYKSSIFNLRNFKDISSPEAHYQSTFIQKYGQYLEEKVLVFKMLTLEFEKDPTVTKTFTVEEAFEKVPRLQSQLNALLNCRAAKNHINNPIIVFGFTLLLKDSFKLYRALNDAIINVLEHYFTMNKATAQKALDIYKLFTKETDGIIQFFDMTRKFSKTDLPELQHAPTTLVEALENYLKDIDEGRGAQPQGNAASDRGKKLAQQMDLFSFDEAQFDKAHQQEDSDSEDDKGGHDQFHQQHQPQRGASGSNAPAPAFDPFSEPSDGNSRDNLPTYSSNTGGGNNPNFFDNDPFGFAPSNQPQVQQQNQPGYVDKKKQIEMVMQQNTGFKPLQPQPLSPSSAPTQNQPQQPQANYNINLGGGFGQPNQGGGNQNPFGNNMGFGNNQPFGGGNQFGGQPQNNNMGFGNNQPFGGSNMGGFGGNQGFGNQPFGGNNQFGGQPQQPQNNNMGFGNQPFGGSNNTAPNNNNPFFSNTTPQNNTQNNANFNPFA